jgi:hypothetical protein
VKSVTDLGIGWKGVGAGICADDQTHGFAIEAQSRKGKSWPKDGKHFSRGETFLKGLRHEG